MPDQHLAYRPDIDGLRAVAVIAVIGAHAFPTSVPGGFIGVDIFFVISGFLITAILQREITDASFSVGAFYGRRIRRLFPALAIVLGACLLAGHALLFEAEYRQLGWHVAAGSGFFANIALWAEAGYFDRESELKPLLHLWSLGIEEQFYLLWPLLIALALKARASLAVVAVSLALLSFGTNLATAQTQPTAAFFLPFARFWELLLGAALAILQHRRHQYAASSRHAAGQRAHPMGTETCALVGLSLIVLALALLGPDTAFPGWWALLPAVGTALLIGAGPDTWISRRVMATRPLVWIGLISYPLYLWHWPLLSFARILLADVPPSLHLALIGVALLLAIATYRLVELPLRQTSQNMLRRRQTTALLATTLSLLLLAGLLAHQRIPKERLYRISEEISAARRDWEYPGDARAAHNGKTTERVLFLGDSYIQQLYPRIAQFYRQAEPVRSAYFHTAGGCTPVPGITRRSNSGCAAFFERGMELAAAPETSIVVIGGSWLGMTIRGDYVDVDDTPGDVLDFADAATLARVLKHLEHRLAALTAQGKEVHVLLNPPGGHQASPERQEKARFDDSGLLAVKTIPLAEHLARTGRINAQLRTLAESAGAAVIDPADWICADARCHFTDAQGIPYFMDMTHFRASFVRAHVTDFDALLLAAGATNKHRLFQIRQSMPQQHPQLVRQPNEGREK